MQSLENDIFQFEAFYSFLVHGVKTGVVSRQRHSRHKEEERNNAMHALIVQEERNKAKHALIVQEERNKAMHAGITR